MFYIIPFLPGHPATLLQTEVKEFIQLLIHKKINSRSLYVNDNTYFSASFSDKLKISPKLNQLFKNFFDAYKILPTVSKKLIVDQFVNCEPIDDLLGDDTRNVDQLSLSSLPYGIQKKIHDMFLYLYDSTLQTNLKIHYSEVFEKLPTKYCPFCGIEKLPKPNIRKADYDHIIYKGKYPQMAINMRNLIPMGLECNRDYKKQKDVLFTATGKRRIFINPFTTNYTLSLSLRGSILPNALYKNGIWKIQFFPNDNIIDAWKDVFEIEQRYVDELEEHFTSWLEIFKEEYKGCIFNINQLKEAFSKKANSFKNYWYKDSNIIKFGLFDFLSNCNDYVFYDSIIKDMTS